MEPAIDPCEILFIFLAKGLRELLLFIADENHHADIQVTTQKITTAYCLIRLRISLSSLFDAA